MNDWQSMDSAPKDGTKVRFYGNIIAFYSDRVLETGECNGSWTPTCSIKCSECDQWRKPKDHAEATANGYFTFEYEGHGEAKFVPIAWIEIPKTPPFRGVKHA